MISVFQAWSCLVSSWNSTRRTLRSLRPALIRVTRNATVEWPRLASECSLPTLGEYFGQWGWVVRPGRTSDRHAFEGECPPWVVEAPDGERHRWTLHGFNNLAEIHEHWSWAGPVLWRYRCAEEQLKTICNVDMAWRQAVWDWIMNPMGDHPALADALRGGPLGGEWTTALTTMAPRRFDTARGAGLHDALRFELLAHLHALGFHGRYP